MGAPPPHLARWEDNLVFELREHRTLNEQRRIVEKIETLFARLDKGEEVLRNVQKLLARYRQSVLKAAVSRHLTADWRRERPPCCGSGIST